jgi:signal transduction histidine kinase/ActR/RegA family two-component response regulator
MLEDPKYEAILRTLKRERLARKAAERVIEEKSSEIFRVNKELIGLNQNLEKRITERTKDIKKSNKELAIAKKIAEDATKSKSLFLSNMSHEIRTPLNGIIGLTELLLGENHDEKTINMLDSIKYSADHLIHIINEILDFSKIEAGKIEFEKVDFNLRRLIDEMLKNMTFTVKSKGLDLKYELDENLPDFVNGDPVKLNQILTNLLGNAVKFTKSGFIKLMVSMKKPDAYGNIQGIYFCVADTGIGIPEDKLESIFQSFQQSDSSTTREFGGTGLGLTISKSFVELQGGKMWVNSKVGQGSVFQFIYPCEILKMKAKTALKTASEEYVFTPLNKNILVVEDNKLNQFVVTQFLNKWNSKVDIANNGVEALYFLSKKEYDIVLMDIQMPELNGLDASKEIRKKGSSVLQQNIPIIALTANAFDETRKEIEEAGMNGFVSKPIIPKNLHQLIVELTLKSEGRNHEIGSI